MSAVSVLSSMRERPSETAKDGSNQEGMDDDERPAGGGDPAVLAMGAARRPLTYTRDELMRLRNSPLVKRGLEHAFAGCDALALVLKRRSDSPNEDDRGGRGDAPNENHKGVYGRERDRERRSADPRERVRKESEPTAGGIVLSPQRRSFTSGCGAPAAAAPPPHVARTRPESPLSGTAAQPAAAKNEPAGRRIGSGRIMVRDSNATWEEGEWVASEPYRPPRERERERDERHTRANGERSVFERRSFGRDNFSSDIKRERDDRFNNEKTRDREENRRSGGRYNQRRYDKEDEPEWFSGGPTSKLETIELRGFDEPIKKNGTTNKETEKWNNGSRSPERWRSEAAPSPDAAANANDQHANTNDDKEPVVEAKNEEPPPSAEQPDFNLDEFLKFDTIPDELTNGVGESEGGSRFSRWFRRDSPSHYERLLNDMVDDLDNSIRVEPPPVSEPQHVFAPISPAGVPPSAHSHPAHSQPAPPSLLELLRRANANAEPRPPELNSIGGGKIHSLEELEARLRPQHSAPPPQPPPDHDMAAFKRLLAQVSGGHAVPATEQPRPPPPQPQPMSLLQMLNKSMEQTHKPPPPAAPAPPAQPPHIPQELLYKLLQVQQRQQGHHGGDMGSRAPPTPAPAGPTAADRELLQRPEAQAIIHGLKAGEITVQHLMQQLGNPGMQSRHREVLLTILRLHQQQRQMGGSPLPSGVGGVGAAAHLVVPPHHQPLRLSPLPHPGVPARIPSPRELAAHTQSIMQGALIKKKLEEQRENYRRRHEMHQKQPTPISFTPTSVLRKMTAEKESDAPSPKQQWSQPPKMPQGRPIVKGNQSGAPPSMGYAPSPADYQQHYLTQQQQMVGGVRPFPQQQRQQMPASVSVQSSSFPSMNNMRGMPAGTTLHQLLVQSHQRSLNEMGGATGGGDNQLARWFSPELLARASAGKLPSVHVPNALSLEDLERHHHSPAPPVRN